MGRKKKEETTPYAVRCPISEEAQFEAAAAEEGFSSVNQWLLWLGRRRAKEVLAQSETATELEFLQGVVEDLKSRVAAMEPDHH